MGMLYPGKSTIITNMDGWMEALKYSKKVQEFLKLPKSLPLKYSDYYISDSVAIKSYLGEKYAIDSKYILTVPTLLTRSARKSH